MDDDESFEWDGDTDKYTYSYRQLREEGEGLMADTDDIGGRHRRYRWPTQTISVAVFFQV